MKKVIQIIIISLFTIFSFYYTDKIIEFSKKQDPIMTEIINLKEEKEIEPVNAILSNNTMLVGKSGLKIDIDTSYEQMKKLDEFNENLLEYISIKPSITKEDNYEKLIIGSNTKEKKISFVFKLDSLDKLDQIAYILKSNNLSATFFIDGKVLEDNIIQVKTIFSDKLKLGLYSYDNNYNSSSLRYNQGLINNNASYSNYCLYENKEFLSTCKNNRINTIKPELIEKNIYNYLKENKKEGSIYQITLNSSNIKELNSTIIYLKQKGYEIVSLDDLLKE
ncbi:MAG: hypothetical protein ACI31R_05280 [Bacilli bacterium]